MKLQDWITSKNINPSYASGTACTGYAKTYYIPTCYADSDLHSIEDYRVTACQGGCYHLYEL